MQIHNLKRTHKNKKDRLVGRGGKHAKTSGRGGKGQTARAGNKRRPELRDIIKKLPKNRGYQFKSINRVVEISKDKALPEGLTAQAGKKTTFKEMRKRLNIKGGKIKVGR
jgi:ribosomal protein L15